MKRDQDELDRLNKLKRAEEDAFLAASANDRGLLARLDALTQVTGRNRTLGTAYLALLHLLAALDVLPVLVNFLTTLGQPTRYDRLVARPDAADL